MKQLAACVLTVVMSLGFSAVAAAAQVYVVHGIPGQDVGAAPDLPVDICLAGGGAVPGLTGVPFGAIAGPLDLPAGRYDIEVRLAGGAVCGGALAVANTFYLALTENATIVAHLSEQGIPALTKFINDVRPLGSGRTRVVARHGAAVPPVNILLRSDKNVEWIKGLENSDQSSGVVERAGTYHALVFPEGSLRPVLSTSAPLAAGTVYFAYAVGSAAKGTLALVVQAIPLP
jgi:hypothetical protein